MSFMTFVLIPGAGGDAYYWHLVAERLRAAGHEVVAPDLPAADEAAGFAEYADAVVAAIGDRTAGLVVVGQSIGAYTASLVCTRVPVARVVLVVPMIPAPGETPGEWWEASGQLAAMRANEVAEGRDPDAPFDVDTAFLHDLSPAVKADLLAQGEPEQAGRPMGEPWPLEAWPDVPTDVIVGRHDRLIPVECAKRIARERLGVEPDVIDTGHLPALADPDGLAERLAAYAG